MKFYVWQEKIILQRRESRKDLLHQQNDIIKLCDISLYAIVIVVIKYDRSFLSIQCVQKEIKINQNISKKSADAANGKYVNYKENRVRSLVKEIIFLCISRA